MNLTNDSYIILICGKTWEERYYRDKAGWLKVSARGRKLRATAEQVLNHVLPALAGIKPTVSIKVRYRPRNLKPTRRPMVRRPATASR
jgi:hypothetical protein